MKNLMKAYRLPETSTPENLACNWSTVLTFGNHILLSGYIYQGRGKDSNIAAIYGFTTDDHTCEGEIRLLDISEDFFPDNGSAVAWCIQKLSSLRNKK